MSTAFRLCKRLLSCRIADLPFGAVLYVKLMVLVLWIEYFNLNFIATRDFRTAAFLPFTPFLPLIPLFNYWPYPSVFGWILGGLFVVASAWILLGRHFQRSCLILGLAILTSQMASRNSYGNDVIYVGLVFIIVGLSEPSAILVNLRRQLAIVYFGAAINKICDADWWSGQYMVAWKHFFHAQALDFFSANLPFLFWERAFGWLAILIEMGFAVAAVSRRPLRAMAFGVFAFHFALSLFSGATFHMFFYAMSASLLFFLEWPEQSRLAIEAGPSWTAALGRLDLDGQLTFSASEGKYATWMSVASALARLPVTYYFLAVVLAAFSPNWRLSWLTYVVTAAVLGLVSLTCAVKWLRLWALPHPERAAITEID